MINYGISLENKSLENRILQEINRKMLFLDCHLLIYALESLKKNYKAQK